MKRPDRAGRGDMLQAIVGWERETSGARMLGALGFANAYAFAMRGDRARALGIASLDDLAAKGRDLVIGSDLEFFRRPEWRAVDRAYGLGAMPRRSFSPTFMYDALASGEADVISAFSSDGRIAADKLVVLTDPREALPAYDAVLLVAPQRADDARFLDALRPLIGAIRVEAMREANYSVDRTEDKKSPADAAKSLDERIAR
jgi:osmoprotectant transport system permease protein